MKRLRLLFIALCLVVTWAMLAGCGGGKPENSLPAANAGSDHTVQIGDTVYFSGAGADADGAITKYEWDFDGDGIYDWNSETSGSTTHVCNTAGTFTAVLRVTDDDGATATDNCTITVRQIVGTVDISGVWNGEWYRSDGGEIGTLTATIIQSENSLSGDITITSITFEYSRDTTVMGSVEGIDVVFGIAITTDGETVTIDYTGTLSDDGDFMEGTYTMSTGYSGSWTAVRGAATITPTTTTTPTTTQTAAPTPTTTTAPTTTTTETSQIPTAVEVELVNASVDNLIEFQVSGTGSLDRIMLTLTSKADDTLEIDILPGTLFLPQSTDISGMIITTEKRITLQSNETAREVNVDAASTNMPLDVPGSNDTLVLGTAPVNEDLVKLCSLPDFQQETFRIQQFAIWTITDNPRPDGYTGIGMFGFGSGPSDEEMTTIEVLFTKAGIQVDKYWAFQQPIYVELLDASSRDLITVSAYGAGSLESIELSLTSLSDQSLEVAILPGTVFYSQSASIQNMLIIEERLIVVYPYETIESIEVAAACANMVREVPAGSDILIMSNVPVSGDLMKLLNLPEFYAETYRVKQFAIWTITDNPTRGEYIGIGMFGMGTGPSDDEMNRIRYLFERAGISTEQYQALG